MTDRGSQTKARPQQQEMTMEYIGKEVEQSMNPIEG